jgi:hypothetical protein
MPRHPRLSFGQVWRRSARAIGDRGVPALNPMKRSELEVPECTHRMPCCRVGSCTEQSSGEEDRTLRYFLAMTGRDPGKTDPAVGKLEWLTAACIGLSLTIMLVMSFNGPSVTVSSAIEHGGLFPPWWQSFHLGASVVLLSLWAAALLGTAGVIGGIVAVARGARPSPKALVTVALLITAAFIVLPPAGSADVVSYAIDGAMVAAGHSPYAMTPASFIKIGGTIAKYGSPTWQTALSDYGPLATWTEWLAVKLGAGSTAPLHLGEASITPITAWLKLWTGLSFATVVLLLDRQGCGQSISAVQDGA